MREARGWMAPASNSDLSKALTALYVKTLRRKETETELSLALEIYLAELRQWPGDVAIDAMASWPSKFFPAWSELKEAITADRRIRERRLRIKALEAFLEGRDEEAERRARNRPTAEQIARNAAYIGKDQPAERTKPDPYWTEERQAEFYKKNPQGQKLIEKARNELAEKMDKLCDDDPPPVNTKPARSGPWKTIGAAAQDVVKGAQRETPASES